MNDKLWPDLKTPVGFAPHLLEPRSGMTRDDRIRCSRERLCRVLNLGTTVAFIGSGSSAALGYPTWNGLALELVKWTINVLKERPGSKNHLERCESLQARLQPKPCEGKALLRPSSDEMTFAISFCREVLEPEDLERGKGEYWRYLKKAFRRRPASAAGSDAVNPYLALLDLPIYRFVTTNYDYEIERALSTKRNIPCEEFGLSRLKRSEDPRSFTQKRENWDQLTRFALADIEEAKNLVFHCHGRIDEPDSIIATESDYQKWYLADHDGDGPAFRQTVDLLLNSNPILFVGYGLGDEDLLRPLRHFQAACPDERLSRPLFALMQKNDNGEDWDHYDYLFERYGLSVLPFTAKDRGLYEALCKLKVDLSEWQESWTQKPYFRKVELTIQPPAPYRHYGLNPDPGEPGLSGGAHELNHAVLGKSEVEAKLQEIEQHLCENKRIIALRGSEGTGKAWHALKLMDQLSTSGQVLGYQGFFFWSSYLSDDIISGIDRLLAYIDRDGLKEESRLERLRKRLHSPGVRYLIIIDGFDRLLRRTDQPDEGRVENPAARFFLEIFHDKTCKSTLLLTGTLWPREVGNHDCDVRVGIERLRSGSGDAEIFGGCEPADVYALFEGHAYALLVAAQYLKRKGSSESATRLRKLRQALFGCPPDGRVGRLLCEVIAEIDSETHGLALHLLKRLSVFMTPVHESTLTICHESIREAYRDEVATPVLDLAQALIESRLLFRACQSNNSGHKSWTVHPIVRRYIFEQVQGVSRDALPHFNLSGFTTGDAAVYPGSPESAEIVKDLWQRLHEGAGKALGEQNLPKATEFCRSLYGLMRSRMESNTAPRWSTYKEYLRLGIQLVDLLRKFPDRWAYCELHHRAHIECTRAPLYDDELAWLYNDIGLSFSACGHMPDCLRVYEQGYAINRVIDGTTPVPRFSLQSEIHLVHTFLDLGKLPMARRCLLQAKRTNQAVQDEDATGRLLCFEALLSHLQGNFEAAERLYGEGLRKLRGSDNTRGESYFLNHRVALDVSLGHLDRADEAARQSRALAETADYPDLVAYARLSQGRICRARKDFVKATGVLNAALTEAGRLELGRLKSEVLIELSRLALDLGDGTTARQRALEALRVSNERGLGLRRSRSLLVLGRATVKAGQTQLGIAYLWQAQKIAKAQEYLLCSGEAAACLEELGERVDAKTEKPAIGPVRIAASDVPRGRAAGASSPTKTSLPAQSQLTWAGRLPDQAHSKHLPSETDDAALQSFADP